MSDDLPDTAAARAFFSYAHEDDRRDHGRVLRLADAIRDEFEMLTGYQLEIFTDRDKIGWGDGFRDKLDEALEETTFFIPILTATYFRRPECRKEMQRFVNSATRLGLDKLLLSIRYGPVPDLVEDSADSLKAAAAGMQYEPWEHLRLVDEQSAEHRTAVHALAARLVTLTSQLEMPDVSRRLEVASQIAEGLPIKEISPQETVSASEPSESDAEVEDDDAIRAESAPARRQFSTSPGLPDEVDDDDAPGTLDLLVDFEENFQQWTEVIGDVSDATTKFNEKFVAGTAHLDRLPAGPTALAQRILAYRALASDIEPELVRLEECSKRYVDGLTKIDPGVRVLAELSTLAAPEQKALANESMIGLVRKTHEAMEGAQGAANAARANSKHSRDLRPTLRRFETAFQNIIDASRLVADWEELFSQPDV